MINVTTEARELLHNILKQTDQKAQQQVGVPDDVDLSIRLTSTVPDENSSSGQAKLELIFDLPEEGDQIVEHNGRSVLLVDQAIGNLLDGATLETVDTPNGRQLAISR